MDIIFVIIIVIILVFWQTYIVINETSDLLNRIQLC